MLNQVTDYVSVGVSEVGFTDEGRQEGVVLLKSGKGTIFTMSSFSGEVALHMKRFMRGDRSSIPSVYNIVEELAEKQGLHLAAVEIFPSGQALRADMQFLGRERDFLLKGYRASDAIALALFYDATIMLHRSLIEKESADGVGV